MSLAFAPGRTIRIWDIASGDQLHVLDEHRGKVSEVSFTPDDTHLVSSGERGFNVWRVETGELESSFSHQSTYVECFAMHPSGQIIAASGFDKTDIWDLRKGELIQSIGNSWPVSLSFSSDGDFLSVGDALTFTIGMDRKAYNGSTMTVWQLPEMYRFPCQSDDLVVSATRHLIEERYFDPENIEDARIRVIASIVRRQGQPEFRRQLLDAYSGRCSITKADVAEALEAAHIVAYKGAEMNCLANGILLRADIHTLFDLYLLSICPESYTVKLSLKLLSTSYKELHDIRINLPLSPDAYPSRDALRQHYNRFLEEVEPSVSATV